jgi:serine phosphatase RsbU (regulator of sigma subunit)
MCFRILVLLVFTNVAAGQEGTPYITYFDNTEGYEIQQWSICEDPHHQMLFANKKGILSYDGSTWSELRLPYIPYRLQSAHGDNRVFVLFEHAFGYLQRNSEGALEYVPMTFEGEVTSPLENIVLTDSLLLVFGPDEISCYALENLVLKFRYRSEQIGKFRGAIEGPDALYIQLDGGNMLYVAGDTLLPAGRIKNAVQEEILFTVPCDKDQVIAGTSDGGLYRFDGNRFSAYPLSNADYLRENMLSGGVLLNDSTYAFSTRFGGVLLVNKADGAVRYTLNYDHGLPDDEIYSMGRDHYGGLWLTYALGICRVDLSLPVKDFSHYPGLKGRLMNVAWYEGEMYIATSEGLFYLSEVKNYEEVSIYLKQAPAPQPAAVAVVGEPEPDVQQPASEAREPEQVETDEERPGFFARLFRRDKRSSRQSDASESDQAPSPPETKEPEEEIVEEPIRKAIPSQPRYIRKTISKLKSIEYIYMPVEGLTSSCEQLLASPHGLIVGASSGLYVVNEHTATRVEDMRNILYITDNSFRNGYIVARENGLARLIFDDEQWRVSNDFPGTNNPFFSAISKDTATLWVSGYNKVIRIEDDTSGTFNRRIYQFDPTYPEEMHLFQLRDTLFLLSVSDAWFYQPAADTFLLYGRGIPSRLRHDFLEYYNGSSGIAWIKSGPVRMPLPDHSDRIQDWNGLWGLFPGVNAVYHDAEYGHWIINEYQSVYQFDPDYRPEPSEHFRVFIEEISTGSGQKLYPDAPEVEPHEKILKIKLSAPYYTAPEAVFYQYRIVEKMERWSDWSRDPTIDLILSPGTFTVLVRAGNILGEISQTESFAFEIRAPLYQSAWFYISFIPVLFALFYLVFHARERKLRRDKKQLEQKVEERTREIQVQKEQIELQRNEIQSQKDEITASIKYASRIQKATLPSTAPLERSFSGHFVLYQPRDIVSGDFYWSTETQHEVIFAAADCTGHGVPGAFMSMLGNSFLNEITRDHSAVYTASGILQKLRLMVTAALTQARKEESMNDGMDIALCIFRKDRMEIEYAGAYNPLYLIRKDTLKEIKGDRMPIGIYPSTKPFHSNKIKVQSGDVLYLFTDGYPDQFGGFSGKKFTTRRFKQALLDIHDKKMAEQKVYLETLISEWQGDHAQVDDILVLGIRI